jgi:hypothetical protein
VRETCDAAGHSEVQLLEAMEFVPKVAKLLATSCGGDVCLLTDSGETTSKVLAPHRSMDHSAMNRPNSPPHNWFRCPIISFNHIAKSDERSGSRKASHSLTNFPSLGSALVSPSPPLPSFPLPSLLLLKEFQMLRTLLGRLHLSMVWERMQTLIFLVGQWVYAGSYA